MGCKVLLTAYGLADENGAMGTATKGEWRSFSVDGPRFVKANSRPFRRFGKLDALSQAVVAATEMLCLPRVADEATPREWGLVLASAYGCLEVDCRYQQSRGDSAGPSPLLFAHTLPSSPLGQLAIRHRVVGPNLCLLTENEPGAEALLEGYHLVAGGEVPACLCVAADSFAAQGAQCAARAGTGDGRPLHWAFAFLLEAAPCEKQAGALAWIGAPDQAGQGRETPGHQGRYALSLLVERLADKGRVGAEVITLSAGTGNAEKALRVRLI